MGTLNVCSRPVVAPRYRLCISSFLLGRNRHLLLSAVAARLLLVSFGLGPRQGIAVQGPGIGVDSHSQLKDVIFKVLFYNFCGCHICWFYFVHLPFFIESSFIAKAYPC
ncbi:hypothetical protein ACOSQ2_024294 [Xanthoceras sorbifolium]